LSNPTEVTILSWPYNVGGSGGTYPNVLFQAWYEGTAGNGTIFYANPCGTETIDDVNPPTAGNTTVRYWISPIEASASTPMGCGTDCVAFDLNTSSAVSNIFCGCP